MKVLRHLAPAAEHERDQRAATLPTYVARGLIAEEDAQCDYQAWCAIALWCAGERIDWSIPIALPTMIRWGIAGKIDAAQESTPFTPPTIWKVMETAAERALAHLDHLRQAKPDDGALAARRGRVAAIHDGLQRARAFYERLNGELRDRARKSETGNQKERQAAA
jgi:hypothetical protein